MKISFSTYRMYLDCPRKYRWTMDRVDPPVEPSKYFALYGLLTERFFEHLSNNHYKKNPNLTPGQIRSLMATQWKFLLEDNYVRWDDPWCTETSSDIFNASYNDVLKCMDTLDFYKNTKAEVTYEHRLKKSGDLLTGRMDFVYINDDKKVEILDGKGTTKKETNVDNDQLYFYALLFLLKHRRLPDKLGFIYYRYQEIQYIDFDMDTIMSFKNRLALVKNAISKDTTWEPRVKITKQCKWCAYKEMCDAYKDKKEENRKKRPKKESSIKTNYNGSITNLTL